MMKCRECGELVQPDDVYCPYCGLLLRQSSMPQAEAFIEKEAHEQAKVHNEARESSVMKGEYAESGMSSTSPESATDELKDAEMALMWKSEAERLGIFEGQEKEGESMAFEDTIPYSSEELKSLPHKVQKVQKVEQEVKATEPKKEVIESQVSEAQDIAKGAQQSDSPQIPKPILEKPVELPISPAFISDKPESSFVETPKIADTPKITDIPSKLTPSDFEISVKSEQDKAESEVSKPIVSAPIADESQQEEKIEAKAKLRPLAEGTVLNGRYEIVKKIGGGGMGAVYLAKDRNLGGAFRAVKEMIQSYIEEEKQEKAVNDFRREALLLSSLEHPSIPTIYDYFHDEQEGRFYLVMKYISGSDLAKKLRSSPEGRIEEKLVTQWAIQIADVLEYLHNHQPPIIYRDLKPSNIMIDNNGKVMLVDFGIARWVRREEKGVTAVGTMGYAPPELFGGIAEPRSDIYSLGATMFHLLTGADPQSNPLLIFDFTKNPRPRQINPALSDQIEQIVMRAVEYKIERRFSSAREMKEALVEHLNNLESGKVTFGRKQSGAATGLSKGYIFCAFCGQKILETDLFCPFCGSKQKATDVGTSVSFKKTKARLYVVSSDEQSVPVFEIEKDSVLVGRRDPLSNIYPDIDLTRFDPQTKISRRHARIWREGDKFMIEDLGSSNGTTLLKINNEILRLLPRQPKQLSNGDKIKLGDTTLRFVVG